MGEVLPPTPTPPQFKKKLVLGTSLVVQWLELHASDAGGPEFGPWLGN